MSDAPGPAKRRKAPSATRLRQRARHCVVQALYQAQVNPQQPVELVAQFRADNDFEDVDVGYFDEAVLAVLRRADELDLLFAPLLDRALDELDPVELGILRLATWELSERTDVPYRVVIDEAVNLAKRFGASESHRYVNGVLDRAARSLRGPETGARA